MTTAERGIEVKVGALVLFSIALLLGFLFLLGDCGFDSGRVIFVDFQDAGALKPGAKVKVGGVTIGKVRRLIFMGGEVNAATGEAIWVRVEAEIETERWPALRNTSTFTITTEGVLGEQFLAVSTRDPGDEPVAEGHIFRGKDPVRLDHMLDQLSESLDGLNRVLNADDLHLDQTLRSVDSLASNLDDLLRSNRQRIEQTLESADRLMRTTHDIMSENRDGFGAALAEGRALIADGRVTLARVQTALQRLEGDWRRLLAPAEEALASATAMLAHLSQELQLLTPRLHTTLDHVDAVALSLHGSAGQVEEMVAHVRAGRGTVGMLVYDDEIFDTIREMLRELKRRPWKLVWKE